MWRRLSRMNKVLPLKLERMWIVPVLLIAALAALTFAPGQAPVGLGWVWATIALVAGGVVGWFRGKLMQVIVDPQTHDLNQKASPLAVILLLVIAAVRYGLRYEAQNWGLDVVLVTYALTAFVVGMFTVVRIEMFIRARKMLAQARALGAPAGKPLLDVQR
jgi:hypothetical protein